MRAAPPPTPSTSAVSHDANFHRSRGISRTTAPSEGTDPAGGCADAVWHSMARSATESTNRHPGRPDGRSHPIARHHATLRRAQNVFAVYGRYVDWSEMNDGCATVFNVSGLKAKSSTLNFSNQYDTPTPIRRLSM